MNKIKAFFIGNILLCIVFATIVLSVLIYRANEQEKIKSYIFQMNDLSSMRVGELQNINDISPDDLRNKLITKYVSEYFKVIPGETNVSDRRFLKDMSSPEVFNQWQNNEAKTIADMSENNMFRMTRVYTDSIATVSAPVSPTYDKSDQTAFFAVRYYLYTWQEANKIGTKPTVDQGTIYLQVHFKPGIRDEIDGRKINIKKLLKSGDNPVKLFWFKVLNVGNKENI